MDGWMDGWMDGRTDGRTDGWMDGCACECEWVDFSFKNIKDDMVTDGWDWRIGLKFMSLTSSSFIKSSKTMFVNI